MKERSEYPEQDSERSKSNTERKHLSMPDSTNSTTPNPALMKAFSVIQGLELPPSATSHTGDWLVWDEGIFAKDTIVSAYFFHSCLNDPEPFIDVASNTKLGSQEIRYPIGHDERAQEDFNAIKQWLQGTGGTLTIRNTQEAKK